MLRSSAFLGIAGLTALGAAVIWWADESGPARPGPFVNPPPPVVPEPAPSSPHDPPSAERAPGRSASEPAAPRGNELDEAETMTRIRDAVLRHPSEALALIRAADQVHAASPRAEERASLRIDALVNANQVGRARDAAEEFLQRYPEGTYAQHVEMLTGVHPRPHGSP